MSEKYWLAVLLYWVAISTNAKAVDMLNWFLIHVVLPVENMPPMFGQKQVLNRFLDVPYHHLIMEISTLHGLSVNPGLKVSIP